MSFLFALAAVAVLLEAVNLTAYAAEGTLLTTITNASYENASDFDTTDGEVHVAFSIESESVKNDKDDWGWYGGTFSITVTANQGYTITRCKFYTNTGNGELTSAPFTANTHHDVEHTPQTWTTLGETDIGSRGVTKIEVYGYSNKYYVRTPDDLNITQAGWNFPAGIITASADADDFDPSKKLVITASSANGWALKDTIFWHFNTDTVPYTLKNAQTDTTSTTSWEISCADLTKDGGTTITFGAFVEDFSAKRPGAYDDDVSFTVEVK